MCICSFSFCVCCVCRLRVSHLLPRSQPSSAVPASPSCTSSSLPIEALHLPYNTPSPSRSQIPRPRFPLAGANHPRPPDLLLDLDQPVSVAAEKKAVRICHAHLLGLLRCVQRRDTCLGPRLRDRESPLSGCTPHPVPPTLLLLW